MDTPDDYERCLAEFRRRAMDPFGRRQDHAVG